MKTHRIKVKRIDGFTLIELLTVVAIIGLLVGMVVPTIKAVLDQKQQMQLAVRIRSLSAGCDIYKMSATGNRYYPGQDATQLAWLSGTTYAGAGSALLARCLFWIPDNNSPNDLTKGQFPVSNYGQLEKDILGTVTVGSNTVANSIIDYANETMAILYYPSRLGQKGVVAQYVVADNSKYVTLANSAPSTTILTQVLKQPSPVVVYQDGLFVISAAGTNRLYFSSPVDNFH
jgi:prepilin-type N-terminal cleavage/methylation domain-containing protein